MQIFNSFNELAAANAVVPHLSQNATHTNNVDIGDIRQLEKLQRQALETARSVDLMSGSLQSACDFDDEEAWKVSSAYLTKFEQAAKQLRAAADELDADIKRL